MTAFEAIAFEAAESSVKWKRRMRRVNHIRTTETIIDFKRQTDENAQVASILRSDFSEFVPGSVLDVGAGAGDIAGTAWPEHHVVLLDLLDFGAFPKAVEHERIRGDFFDESLQLGRKFSTVLFSHVLQYLDDRPDEFRNRLSELRPRFLLTVTNDGDDPVMRGILSFAEEEIGSINAEERAYSFPEYERRKATSFVSKISAGSHEALAKSFFAVVFDRALNSEELALATRRFRALAPTQPELLFRQTVTGFARNDD